MNQRQSVFCLPLPKVWCSQVLSGQLVTVPANLAGYRSCLELYAYGGLQVSIIADCTGDGDRCSRRILAIDVLIGDAELRVVQSIECIQPELHHHALLDWDVL
jgi:hypothetical protein